LNKGEALKASTNRAGLGLATDSRHPECTRLRRADAHLRTHYAEEGLIVSKCEHCVVKPADFVRRVGAQLLFGQASDCGLWPSRVNLVVGRRRNSELRGAVRGRNAVFSAKMGRQMSKHSGFSVRNLIVSAICAATCASLPQSPAWSGQLVKAGWSPGASLQFGMDADQASQVLGVPLVYVHGRRGNELFLAIPNVKGSALSIRSDALYLQFRKGRLTGWKGDWGTIRP